MTEVRYLTLADNLELMRPNAHGRIVLALEKSQCKEIVDALRLAAKPDEDGVRLKNTMKRTRLFIEALAKEAEHKTGQPALGARQELDAIDAALSGTNAKPQTCLDATGLKITGELYKAVSGHTGDACLLAMIGSWGDTLDDPDILAGLHRYNEMGECFIPTLSTAGEPKR